LAIQKDQDHWLFFESGSLVFRKDLNLWFFFGYLDFRGLLRMLNVSFSSVGLLVVLYKMVEPYSFSSVWTYRFFSGRWILFNSAFETFGQSLDTGFLNTGLC
jgi:hypothetical protein